MNININGNDIELNFGIRFIKELDSKHHTKLANGIEIGTGLEELVPKLIAGDIMALCEIIYTAMWGAKPIPTLDDMYDYIDSAEDIDKLNADVLEELKNWNATKKRAAEMVANMTAEMKAQKTAAKITKTSTKK